MIEDTLDDLIMGVLAERMAIYSEGNRGLVTREIVDRIMAELRVGPKGFEVDPTDVRKGDYIRIEWDDGNATEFTAVGPFSPSKQGTVYLLSPPDPDDAFEFPAMDGAIIRLTPRSNDQRTVASLEHGTWYVAGVDTLYNTEQLRARFYNFEIVKGGGEA